MKEKVFIDLIKKTLEPSYIGDDCAYLADLGIVVTQDNLVEDVHFLRNLITPYQLGYKSVAVNISDICASGAEPKYLTIALSLPDDADEKFIEQFYKGAKEAAGEAKIVGGDITGADKVFISVTAIGSTKGRTISSRNNAKIGQKVVIAGNHGSSAVGLKLLQGEKIPNLTETEKEELISSHLMPKAQLDFSKIISTKEKTPYAMMDTSDGLADAFVTIAEESGVLLDIDFEKIQRVKPLEKLENYENLILYGGEDYGLVATVDNAEGLNVIGEVKQGKGVKINYKNSSEILSKSSLEEHLFKHFKE